MICTRPMVRYHGGKWKLAPWIIGHFPEHRVYTETYGGGASVLLRKKRCYAEVYNDKDGELVNLTRVARDHGLELIEKLKGTLFAREEHELAYEPTEDSVERARRTVVRSFMGFGSNGIHRTTGFRANSNRSGTTPAHNWANLPSAYYAVVERLQGVVIENRDAFDCMKHHDTRQTLHYVDPPYVASSRDNGEDYAFEMTDQEHRELLIKILDLDGMVVLSGYESELYGDQLKGWQKITRQAHADGARDRVEVLWLNPLAASCQPQRGLWGAN